MPRITGDIVIERPVADVFDFVADARNEPMYNRQMLSAQMLDPGPVGVGSRFGAVHRGRRRSMELQTELTEYQRPRRLASTTTMPRGHISGVLTFEPVGSATRMHWDWNLPLTGLARLASPLVKAIGSRQERACWQGLKEHLETESRAMNVNQPGSRHDQKVNVKVVISGLWVSMLFVFAYVDIFASLRADVIKGVLDGKVAGAGVDINQSFLALTTLYILVPALMVAFSLMAPARINRPVNLVVSVLYAVSVVAAAIGETWAYYIIGSVVEVLLLLTIAAMAWLWPVTPAPIDAAETQKSNALAEPAKSRQPSHS